MRSFDEIKHLPQFPGIYGFKGPNNIQDGDETRVNLFFEDLGDLDLILTN